MLIERGLDRRIGDRRVIQIPIDYNARSDNDRRSGEDRRKSK